MSALIVAVTISTASASQGGYNTGDGYDGSRSTIEGSANVSNNGGVIATVRVQSAMTLGAGLIQAGYIKEDNSFSSNCGTGTIGFMVERRPVGGAYRCNAFFGGFGSNHQVTVKHTSDGWRALFDGVLYDGPFDSLSFSNGHAIAVGEYNGNAPSSYSMTFGPGGGTDWQKLNGSNWNTVANASPINDGGTWGLGALPSPFRIYR